MRRRGSATSQEPFLSHLPRLFQTTALHVRFVLWSTCHWAMSMTMRSSNTKQRHRSSTREDDQHLVARFESSLNLLDQSNRLSIQLGIPALLPSPCSVALFSAVFCARESLLAMGPLSFHCTQCFPGQLALQNLKAIWQWLSKLNLFRRFFLFFLDTSPRSSLRSAVDCLRLQRLAVSACNITGRHPGRRSNAVSSSTVHLT